MQGFIDDQLPINDLFTENLNLVLQSYTKKSVTVRCNSKDVFLNPYGFAHGGFLYTMGHIAARNMALVCLGRHMQVVQSTCQYLGMVHSAPITAEAKLMSVFHEAVVCEAKVYDGKGELCFLQTLILQDTTEDGVELVYPKKYKGKTSSNFMNTGIMAKGLVRTFDDVCHVGAPYADKNGIHVQTDLYSDISSERGYVHQGVLFTMCDNCVAACVGMLQKKRPVTVTASIHYLHPAVKGPITATGSLLRAGNKLAYYDIIVRDGTDRKCCKAQFIMNCTDWPPAIAAMLKKQGY